MKLKKHNRYAYSPITERPDFTWPDGKRLAFYCALNVEHFSFGEGLGLHAHDLLLHHVLHFLDVEEGLLHLEGTVGDGAGDGAADASGCTEIEGFDHGIWRSSPGVFGTVNIRPSPGRRTRVRAWRTQRSARSQSPAAMRVRARASQPR